MRVPHLRSDSRGVALPMALGFMLVISIALVTVLELSTSSQRSSARSKAGDDAFAVSEAGLDVAASVLATFPDPISPSALPSSGAPTTISVEGGTATYWGSLDTTVTPNVWTVTSVGTIAGASTGAADLQRTVSREFAVATDEVWGGNYSDATTGCMTINANATFAAPLFVRGNLCLSNGATLLGSTLHVGGTLTMSGSSTIGTAGPPIVPISSANLVGGCTGGVPSPHPCTSSDRVYASSITQNPSSIGKPTVNLPYWYQNAKPGPMQPCTTGSVPGGFDNDSALGVPPNPNVSRLTFNITSGASYDCRVLDGSGNIVGQLAWSAATSTLTIAGTIFVDGNISQSGNVRYVGRGTIYSSGTITLTNNARLCGVAACDATWDPSANLLMLVAGGTATQYGLTLSSNARLQGAAYVVRDYIAASNAVMWGPVVANQLNLSSGSGQAVAVGALPPGAPGMTVSPVTGGWRG